MTYNVFGGTLNLAQSINSDNHVSYFNSLIFELIRLLLAHFVRRGTALCNRGTCPTGPGLAPPLRLSRDIVVKPPEN